MSSYIGQPLLIAAQFKIAVGAPAAPVEDDHERPGLGQRAQIDALTRGIREGERRQTVARSGNAIEQARLAQVLDVARHQRRGVGTHTLGPGVAKGVEFGLKCRMEGRCHGSGSDTG